MWWNGSAGTTMTTPLQHTGFEQVIAVRSNILPCETLRAVTGRQVDRSGRLRRLIESTLSCTPKSIAGWVSVSQHSMGFQTLGYNSSREDSEDKTQSSWWTSRCIAVARFTRIQETHWQSRRHCGKTARTYPREDCSTT